MSFYSHQKFYRSPISNPDNKKESDNTFKEMILTDIHDAERVTQEKNSVLRTQTIIKQHLRIRKMGIQGAPGKIVQFHSKYS